MKANRAIPYVPLAVCALLAAGFASGARAQSTAPAQILLDGKVVGNIGGFVLSTDLKARLNGESTNNADVDFDKTFGKGSDQTRARADVLWRITPTQHLRFLYFQNTTQRKRVIDEDIQWGDDVFTAGGEVKATNKFNIAEVAYEYAFIRQPTFELAGTLGVHWMDIGIKLKGDAMITDSEGNTTSVSGTSKKGSVSAPLPVIGIRAGWVVAPQVYLDAQAQYFKAKVDNIDGSVLDLRAGATWMFSQNFGVGAGYNRFTTNVKVEKNNFDGRLRMGYQGLQVFLTGAF
ncbi:MAG: hypothetical protein K8R60_03720 [Burkholderiales bacterium]|nr:hypothetical protein [Burkholderiales bacterium]